MQDRAEIGIDYLDLTDEEIEKQRNEAEMSDYFERQEDVAADLIDRTHKNLLFNC